MIIRELCYNRGMLKKLIILVILVVLGWYVWDRYGYLLISFQNLPPNSEISTEPVSYTKEVSLPDTELASINLPNGYSIEYFAKNLPGARSLAKGDNGIVYVGTRGEGVVYALEDRDQDGGADTRFVVASGLNNPNGVVFHDGTLFVAEIHRILKFENINETYADKPSYLVLYDQLPSDTHHGWRYLALGPDNKLYLGIGAPCNTCEVDDPYASIARLNLDGSEFEVIARGVRNSVGFDWNPEDESLWFTDNGRDLMGDDVPRDELNQLRNEGEHFGYPYCHEGTVLDPQYGKNKNCDDYASPALPLSPHAAALGMKFVGSQILIAEHGSWNRKVPIGYRLMSVDVKNGVPSNYKLFADGWLGEDGKAKGRPVDILLMTDGSLLVSDDLASAVYLIRYNQP